jgi:hypothetical protein
MPRKRKPKPTDVPDAVLEYFSGPLGSCRLAGEQSDPTRAPGFYDQTYEYLSGLGMAQA